MSSTREALLNKINATLMFDSSFLVHGVLTSDTRLAGKRMHVSVLPHSQCCLLRPFVFCFYQDVNTRGHHSMMCTLWMGWQVIDSMEMGRRGEEVGEGEE